MRVAAIALLAALALVAAAPRVEAVDDAAARLRQVRENIERLRGELADLARRETGVLGEIERAGAERRLRRAELDEVEARLAVVGQQIAERSAHLATLRDDQAERRRWLAFRLREMYKSGPADAVRRWVGGGDADAAWAGVRYASFLSERDGRVLADFRAARRRIGDETAALATERDELAVVRDELVAATARLEAARSRSQALLDRIRDDRRTRATAVAELEEAAAGLERVIADAPGATAPTIDVRRFRGLLDWPAEGRVTAGFGSVVHPRFRTSVPHPGLDIEAGFGAPIRAIFDGRVAFAEWMRGYGMTVIVDHGSGVLSVYAHASVLLVGPGETVTRGQRVGLVGDTGSLGGGGLYFEIRDGGRPVDPVEWLVRRR